MEVYQHCCAENDHNGNPRRVYVIYDVETGMIRKTIDEGYSGKPAECNGLVELMPVRITPKEYKALVNWNNDN